MEIFDISIPLNSTTPVWEGDTGITISHSESIESGADFNVSRIEMGVHSGTHIDAPRHIFTSGLTADQVPMENLIGPVHVLRIPDEIHIIEPRNLDESGYRGDEERFLLKTANSNYWKSDPYTFHKEYAAISSECAEYLANSDTLLIGIDYFSISPYEALKPTHEILLHKGITILENVDLSAVEPGFYNLYCLPLKIMGTDGAPVRAILIRE